MFTFWADKSSQKAKIANFGGKEKQVNIASEASYVYFLSGQQLIKNAAKNGPIWRDFETLKLAFKMRYQTKIGEKCQN